VSASKPTPSGYRGLRGLLSEPTPDEERARLRAIYGGVPLRAPESYGKLKRRLWAYLVVWLIATALALYFAPGLWKVAVAIVAGALAPAWQDLRERYDEYRREWEIGNSESG
jgi:Flp pilus assembly protein TadB